MSQLYTYWTFFSRSTLTRLSVLVGLALLVAAPTWAQDDVESHHLDVHPGDFDAHAKAASGVTVNDVVQLRTGSDAGSIVSPVLEAPVPFNGLAPHWNAETPDGAAIQVEVRTSVDGETWTPWTTSGHARPVEPTLKSTGKPNPHAGDVAGGFVLTDPGSRYAQFRVTLEAGAAGAPRLRRMSLYVVNSMKGPSEPSPTRDEAYNERLQRQKKAGSKSASKPRIYSRSEWGAQAPSASYSYYPADHLALHHSAAASEGNADTWSECAAAVRGIQDYHMYTNGWIDIGYNYVICQTGHIFQGREDGDPETDVIGTHDTHNAGSVAVDGMGNFHPPASQQPTQAMLDSYADLFAWIADRRDIDPDAASYYYGYGGTVDNIYGHRDVLATSCPGDNLYAEIPGIINQVESILSGGADLTLSATWQRNGAANGRPSWFASSGSTERGLAYATMNGKERVYVVSRSSGQPKVHVLDGTDGSDVTTLSTSGISGGTYALNDVEASSDGVLFAANLTVDASQSAFKVYRWDSESDSPTTVISHKTSEALRLGDHITVRGSAADGSLELWAPAASGDDILHFTTSNGVFQAETIEVQSLGGAPSVGAFSQYLVVGSSGDGAVAFDDDGSSRGSAPTSAIPTTVGGLKTYADFSGSTIQKYAAVFDYVSGSEHGGRVRLVDITNGVSTATLEDKTSWMGGADNPNGTGDVAVKSNGDGTFTLFALSTNNGLAAYTTTTAKTLADDGSVRPVSGQTTASNYPNPARSVTHVDLQLSETAPVRVEVYDLLGRQVHVRRYGTRAAGTQTLTLRTESLTSGTYLYRVHVGDRTIQGRMSVVR